jgi:hypothetical protein
MEATCSLETSFDIQQTTRRYILLGKTLYTSVVQSAGWLNIQFAVGTSCERAAPLAEKNAAAWHHVLRSLISLHNEHCVSQEQLVMLNTSAVQTSQHISGDGSASCSGQTWENNF